MKAKKKPFSYSPFMENKTIEERWAIGLRAVWQYIGDDILVDDMGRPDPHKSISRKDVFEVSSDCYFEMYSGLSKEDMEAFRKRDTKKDKALMKLAFPYERYGW